jgi:hypothetical protein
VIEPVSLWRLTEAERRAYADGSWLGEVPDPEDEESA